MASKRVRLSGFAHWALVFEHNKDTKFDPKFSIDLDLTPEELQKFDGTGFNVEARKRKNGFYNFYRKEKNANAKWGGPPRVFIQTKDGITPFDGAIGNGSLVDVNIDVYDYSYAGKKGVGHRLDSVMVRDLIEYNPNGDTEEDNGLDDHIPF